MEALRGAKGIGPERSALDSTFPSEWDDPVRRVKQPPVTAKDIELKKDPKTKARKRSRGKSR